MSQDERASHFQGYAKLVVEEMHVQNLLPGHPKAYETLDPLLVRLLAQRAYDLAFFVVEQTTHLNEEIYLIPDSAILAKIADFTKWPIRSE